MNKPIIKACGETKSERYLADLAQDTFLNLWSYPNVFIDKKQRGDGEGKELCDLLVVCGDHVLIFSDKDIKFQSDKEINLAWSRWYRSAISDSVKQINGAIRWINEYPNRLFLDKRCTIPFPIRLPEPDRIKFHAIVVALGSKEACINYCKGGSGSLLITPELIGDDHVNFDEEKFFPFCVGDINPDKTFVHVLDDVTLDIVMQELDTISDLTDYLEKKEKFIRSGNLCAAHGEEDLLAWFILNFNEKTQEKEFITKDSEERVVISEGVFDELCSNPIFIAKKEADQASYLWDGLISHFTSYMLKGEMLDLEEYPYNFDVSEEALRYMSFENRFSRRILSKTIIDMEAQFKENQHRLCRSIILKPDDKTLNSGYVLLMHRFPDYLPLDKIPTYEEYRECRRQMLMTYCVFYATKNPDIARIIGIASEPPTEVTGKKGSSEDLIMVEPSKLNSEQIERMKEQVELFNIGKIENIKMSRVDEREFPDVPFSFPLGGPKGGNKDSQLNRKQRRALLAIKRK